MGVEVAQHDGVWVLTLDRPPVNALDRTLVEALAAAAATAAEDPGCRAVVLTGRPGVFSAGIDTRAVPAYSAAERADMLRAVNRMVLGVYALPKPTVAAISGHALGGGLVLALACEARLAARGDHRLGLTEAAAGIPFPAGPLAVVEAELPPDARRRLALGSGAFAADDPALAAAIDRVLEPEALLPAAIAEARERAALPAHAAVKRQLRAEAVARLRRVVEDDAEPLLGAWIAG